jgi:hypothetical protein
MNARHTAKGRRLLENAKRQLLELVSEIFHDDDFRFLQETKAASPAKR